MNSIKRVALAVLYSCLFCSLSIEASANDTVITVKNLFRKHKSQLFVSDMMTHYVKICLADELSTCSEEVEIPYDTEHSFSLSPSAPRLMKAFSPDGDLLPESLKVLVGGAPCGHQGPKDKQYFPSQKIPFGISNSKDATTIEIYINGKSWENAVCSIRYKNDEHDTKLGMLAFSELTETCKKEGRPSSVEEGKGVYHYNGYLPEGHYLAEGLWDEAYKSFKIEKIRFNEQAMDEESFCLALQGHLQDLEIANLHKTLQRNSENIVKAISDLDWHKGIAEFDQLFNTINLFNGDWSAYVVRSIHNNWQSSAANHGVVPALDLPELEAKSKAEQIAILNTYIAQSKSVLDPLERRLFHARSAMFFKVFSQAMSAAEKSRDESSYYDDEE